MRKSALNAIHELAREDERVVFIGSDLGAGTLEPMRREMPERFFMEGISEQHIIGMAAGLAMEGYIPYVNTIATFLTRRCFEQIAVDLCMHNLPVRLIGNGGGMVYAPLGPTHTATEDIALMRILPEMTVVAPCDADEIKRLMPQTLEWPGPLYIRLAKGGDEVVSNPQMNCTIGEAVLMRDPGEVLFISTGIMTQRALQAAGLLAEQGIAAGVLHCHTIMPLESARLHSLASRVKLMVTLEEHTLAGGFGSAILELLSDRLQPHPPILRIGLPKRNGGGYGSQDHQLTAAGLDALTISQRVIQQMNKGALL
ncbi:MAG: transketolase C-terminal domain-containing protein [Sedimenticola sp.]